MAFVFPFKTFSMPETYEYGTGRAQVYEALQNGAFESDPMPILSDETSSAHDSILSLPFRAGQCEHSIIRGEFRTRASYRNRGRKRRTFRDLH